MNTQETIIQLKELKLKGMAASLEAIMTLPVQNRPTLELAIARMVEAEQLDRRDRKTEMYLKTSRLRYTALLEDIICGADRNFTKEDLAALSDCSFIRRHENLLIQGKCGCGKSFLACALGRQACILGYRTVYLNMNSFVEKVAISKLDGSFLKMITSLEKNDLIIRKHPIKYTNNNGCNSFARVCSHCCYNSGNHCYFSICVVRVATVHHMMHSAYMASLQ